MDKAQNDEIANALRSYVDDPAAIKPSDTETLGLNFWLLPLNSSTAEEVEKIPNVRFCTIHLLLRPFR